MDDNQIWCVGECMSYCVNKHCQETPVQPTSCEQSCGRRHMEGQGGPNFVDYSMCMAGCTTVPVGPDSTIGKMAANSMNVTTTNMVGCKVNLRSVDPSTGGYGPAFCSMENGTSCTATTDFIAVVADGTGRYDAGDPFDQWWGDESWKDAQETLELHQGSNPEYIEYVKPKPTAMLVAPLAMKVTTINMVGCKVNLRSVDPSTGGYGPAFCSMENGTSCTATTDFIAVVADGTGRYDAGDPFDQWWGCLLYTSDAADEEDSVDLGGRRIIKKKKT
eukprot:TRINITY_DN4278_c0_g1_i3.p1 TRINITY_DN4278_c0_g1~~TRINITY_DN4278_c0_g1_i3.p1  ORF type:complete len:275 (+),score=54.65 TRINITY_DN4278_c0_g1_i3:266-1090(+)